MTVENKKLALKRKFLRYVHPLKSITKHLDQKECWIEQMEYLVQDFKTLLSLPFNEFWSTIVFNKQATVGLNTFFQEAAPPHLMDQFPQDDNMLNVYNEIEHFAFLFLKRLTTSTENEQNYMSPNYMWDLLYNNNIINITMLYDICSIYCLLYKNELKIMFQELFSCQKSYIDDLKNSVQYTIKCLSQFQDKIELDLEYDNHLYQSSMTSTEIEEINVLMIEDIIHFLLDTSYSISNFLEVFPMASSVFFHEKLHIKIASFYHTIKPIIYKKIFSMNKLEQYQEKLHASRLLLVKSVRQCLVHLTSQIANKKESNNPVEQYLDVVSELLVFNEFISDYNIAYNLVKDIKKCQKINKEIDAARYDYLLKSLSLINMPNEKLKQEELQEQQLEQQISSTNIENAKLKSLISDVKDLLPHLGNGFIQKCLEYYDMDSEKVINMILEDKLPLELTQYDFNLPEVPENDIDYEDNATGYDPSAKGNKKLKKLKAVLDDKTFRNEMRPFFEKYHFTEVTCAELESYYDDEYDDTYDEVEYVIPEPADENAKRRPDVVPRVLATKKVVIECEEEDISDDEPQQVLNFQPFCENPVDVRERQAQRYASKQSNRNSKPKLSVPSGSTSGSNVELERQRKNENKAFRGNHNRRNAARSKQQRGMF